MLLHISRGKFQTLLLTSRTAHDEDTSGVKESSDTFINDKFPVVTEDTSRYFKMFVIKWSQKRREQMLFISINNNTSKFY